MISELELNMQLIASPCCLKLLIMIEVVLLEEIVLIPI
jgi:hypothetical protein